MSNIYGETLDNQKTGDVSVSQGDLTVLDGNINTNGNVVAGGDVNLNQTDINNIDESRYISTADNVSEITLSYSGTINQSLDLNSLTPSGGVVSSVAGKTGAVILEASDVVSGVFADARISQSSVSQHQTAIDHDQLTNYVASEHVPKDDLQTSVNNLWSADKIQTELNGKLSSGNATITDSLQVEGTTSTIVLKDTDTLGGNLGCQIEFKDSNDVVQGKIQNNNAFLAFESPIGIECRNNLSMQNNDIYNVRFVDGVDVSDLNLSFNNHQTNNDIHRQINDAGNATTDLVSANYVNTQLATKLPVSFPSANGALSVIATSPIINLNDGNDAGIGSSGQLVWNDSLLVEQAKIRKEIDGNLVITSSNGNIVLDSDASTSGVHTVDTRLDASDIKTDTMTNLDASGGVPTPVPNTPDVSATESSLNGGAVPSPADPGVLNDSAGTTPWGSLIGTYSSSGLPISGETTNVSPIGNVVGEWFQVQYTGGQISDPIISYTLGTGNSPDFAPEARMPSQWVLAGSTDGVSWTVIDDRRVGVVAEEPAWTGLGQQRTYSGFPAVATNYTYYRLIATRSGTASSPFVRTLACCGYWNLSIEGAGCGCIDVSSANFHLLGNLQLDGLLNMTDYDIVAQNANGALPVTGGTISGDLTIQDVFGAELIMKDNASATNTGSVRFRDTNDTEIGIIRGAGNNFTISCNTGNVVLSTFAGIVDIQDSVNITGTLNTNTITPATGDLILSTAGGKVDVQDDANITGTLTVGGVLQDTTIKAYSGLIWNGTPFIKSITTTPIIGTNGTPLNVESVNLNMTQSNDGFTVIYGGVHQFSWCVDGECTGNFNLLVSTGINGIATSLSRSHTVKNGDRMSLAGTFIRNLNVGDVVRLYFSSVAPTAGDFNVFSWSLSCEKLNVNA